MQKIIAANWKMHKIRPQAAQTAAQLSQALANGTPKGHLVVVFPPYTDISTVADAFSGVANLAVGGQNFYPEQQGAFTGEISIDMLRDAGAVWVLVGHSERRHIFGESDGLIARKTAYSVAQGFKVMLCVGETLEEREAGQLKSVLSRQLSTALAALDQSRNKRGADQLVIAYEPVWAIGTGKVAGPDEILVAHAAVRAILKEHVGEGANDMHILYGGSVKPGNAASILALENVDGLLVGGASLEAESFLGILRA